MHREFDRLLLKSPSQAEILVQLLVTLNGADVEDEKTTATLSRCLFLVENGSDWLDDVRVSLRHHLTEASQQALKSLERRLAAPFLDEDCGHADATTRPDPRSSPVSETTGTPVTVVPLHPSPKSVDHYDFLVAAPTGHQPPEQTDSD